MKRRDETIVAIKYEGNEDMEFIVPDRKMELVRALLFEVCFGAQGGSSAQLSNEPLPAE